MAEIMGQLIVWTAFVLGYAVMTIGGISIVIKLVNPVLNKIWEKLEDNRL